MTVIHYITFAAFVAFVLRVASRISGKSLSEIILTAFIVFTGSIIVTGFVLSWFYRIHDTNLWAISVFVPAFMLYSFFLKRFGRDRRESATLFELFGRATQRLFEWFWSMSLYLRWLFVVLFLSFFSIAAINVALVRYTVPNEWDSMTGHLVRVVYFLQHHTMRHFGGTNWNIDTYPKSISTIQIYSYLISGKIENFFKLIHFTSYFICCIAAYGIAHRISKNLTASIFCMLVIGLLPNVLTQATSTETDIVLCAYLSCLVYFLLTFRETHLRRYLYLAGLTFGIAYGHKITFTLVLPSLSVIIFYCLIWRTQTLWLSLRWLKHFTSAVILGLVLFTLPTGYLENMVAYKHPIGPPTALKHQSIERAGSLSNLVKQGTRNMFRYGFDFVNLDGLRNTEWGNRLNQSMKKPWIALERKSPLRLESETSFTIIPFTYDRRWEFRNANPYYGIFGFALMFPLLCLVLFGQVRSEVHFFFGIAFLLHFVALAYSAAYDPWKGRYFQSSAVFLVPFLTLLFAYEKPFAVKFAWFFRTYSGIVILVGCVSAVYTIFLNERCLPFPAFGRKSALDTDRITHQTWARPDITAAYQKFNAIVPDTATVALATINDDFEYPLFGKKLTRKLIPINPFEKGLQPIPAEASYLFFAKKVIQPQTGDIRLGTDTTFTNLITTGEDYYLRKLNQ